MGHKIDKYTGEKNQNFRDWWFQFEIMVDDLVDETKKIKTLPLYLTGEALRYYVDLANDKMIPEKMTEMKDLLASKFTKRKVMLCKMNRGLSEYINEFEQIVESLAITDEQKKIEAFRNGMADEYSKMLLCTNPGTYKAAKEIARKLHGNREGEPLATKDTFSEEEILQTFRTDRMSRPGPWDQAKMDLYEKGLCFKCKKEGHRANECRMHLKARGSQ